MAKKNAKPAQQTMREMQTHENECTPKPMRDAGGKMTPDPMRRRRKK